jgi:serine/threonine protein kinase
MASSPTYPHWHEVSPSRHDHEREALEFLRKHLPRHEPWRVWTNFQFVAADGSLNEVDAFVLGKLGAFLVEIKCHVGDATGNQDTLSFKDTAGNRKRIEHPLRLADLKAKRLKSLLQQTTLFARRLDEVPFIEPVVFLAGATSLDVAGGGNMRVFLRDREAKGGQGARKGIIAALVDRDGAGLERQPRRTADKPLAKALEAAFDEIGISRLVSRRLVGDYELTETLEETQVYRDSLAVHTGLKGSKARARRYFVPRGSELKREDVEKSTRREAQLLERLSHPGVPRVRGFTSDGEGPVVFFEHVEGAVRLDRWFAEFGSTLALDDRVHLLREIAETIKHAHERQVVNRCLSPQSIVVVPDDSDAIRGLRVVNWSCGSADGASASSAASILTATLHPEAYQERASAVYLAPELRRNPELREPTLDVFSLGALAYFILSGKAPAESVDELWERISGTGLHPSASVEAVPQSFDLLVAYATDPVVQRRTRTVDEFLRNLDKVEEELTRPPEVCTDPRDAGPKTQFADGIHVVRRLGSGATAIAFLVERHRTSESSERFVLKVAREPDQNERIRAEAAVLAQLDHPHIARAVDVVDIGRHVGMLTRPAGEQTLRERLRHDGRIQLEFLERWGNQLLDALVHLEAKGISHRDIKPDNIAVTDDGRKKAFALVLFDFSLSGAPTDRLTIGTPAYSDPFLALRPTKRWDLHAERFSAAMTLHEMATGALPRWGDGQTDPRFVDKEVDLDAERFPAGTREGLSQFFARALARDTAKRFDNAEAMRAAWQRALTEPERPRTPHPEAAESNEDDLTVRLAALGVKTPLIELPFSTRATSAFEALAIDTVEQLLRTPPNRVRQVRGVGAKTREEIESVSKRLRVLFPHIAIVRSDAPNADAREVPATRGSTKGISVDDTAAKAHSIDELLDVARRAVANAGRSDGRESRVRAIEALLGLDTDPPRALAFPTQTEAATTLDVTRGRLGQIVGEARDRWVRFAAIQTLVRDIGAIVDRNHGITTVREAAESLCAERIGDQPAVPGAGNALDRAAALVRVAAETCLANDVEAFDQARPTWTLVRRDTRVYLAHSDEHVEYVERVVARGAELARREPLPSRAAVEAELLAIARSENVPPIPPGRLARLVASVQPDVGLSGRGELYPHGLEPARALKLSLGALINAGAEVEGHRDRRCVTVDEIRKRVQLRYPEAAPLPDHPELDQLLRAAGWDAIWSDDLGGYRTRVGDTLTIASASSIQSQAFEPVDLREAPRRRDARDLEVRRFDDEIRGVLEHRRFLVLKVEPKRWNSARRALCERYPQFTAVDLDARIVTILDEVLRTKKIDPQVFFAAEESGESGAHWRRARAVVEAVFAQLREELTSGSGPILVHNVGLLGRYGDFGPLEAVNGLAGGHVSRACLVLVPSDPSRPGLPLVFAGSVPALAHQSRVVPVSWLPMAP